VADRAVWAEDEARFGLKTWHKQRWMAPGCRPDWVGQQKYQWFYLYGGIEPPTGRSLFWIMPDLTKESVEFFVGELRKGVEGEVALVWDRAGAHRAMEGGMPEEIIPVFLPSYSPELNPVEQVWRALRKKLANRIFETLEELEEAVCEALKEYWEWPEVLISLTAYPWWREALQK
jgi:transposase